MYIIYTTLNTFNSHDKLTITKQAVGRLTGFNGMPTKIVNVCQLLGGQPAQTPNDGQRDTMQKTLNYYIHNKKYNIVHS